jgi:phage repressor protein C with HTH and peptisase S24 domain
MFVAQVKGTSMEPDVPDGSYCLFASPVEGSRTGRRLLIERREAGDPEGGGSYILKRFDSSDVRGKDADAGSEREGRVLLHSYNVDFGDRVIDASDEGGVRVIAELLEVLKAQ